MWTKIVLWVSLSYKRLDLSDLLPVMVGNAVIHEVPGIKRAITYTNSDGLLTLKTEGKSFNFSTASMKSATLFFGYGN